MSFSSYFCINAEYPYVPLFGQPKERRVKQKRNRFISQIQKSCVDRWKSRLSTRDGEDGLIFVLRLASYLINEIKMPSY